MKKLPWLLVIGLLVTTVAFTGNTGNNLSYQLNSDQIQQIKSIIGSDDGAKAVYEKILHAADKALKLEPNPVEKIQVEHTLDSDPVHIASLKSFKDMTYSYSLSMAYLLTDDAKYLTKAKEYILAWAKTNQPTGNPINETNLEPIIKAYELLKDEFSSEERAVAEKWFTKIAQCEIASRNGRNITNFNNWNSHRLKLIGLIAFALKNEK